MDIEIFAMSHKRKDDLRSGKIIRSANIFVFKCIVYILKRICKHPKKIKENLNPILFFSPGSLTIV